MYSKIWKLNLNLLIGESVDGSKNVRAIQESGKAIYEQLSSIREYFPLVNPFETELYGSKGFKAAKDALQNMLKSLILQNLKIWKSYYLWKMKLYINGILVRTGLTTNKTPHPSR